MGFSISDLNKTHQELSQIRYDLLNELRTLGLKDEEVGKKNYNLSDLIKLGLSHLFSDDAMKMAKLEIDEKCIFYTKEYDRDAISNTCISFDELLEEKEISLEDFMKKYVYEQTSTENTGSIFDNNEILKNIINKTFKN